MSLIMNDPIQWVNERCSTKEDVKALIVKMLDVYENWEDEVEEEEESKELKKYHVHYGVRLTKDYYIGAHDEEEAQRIAENYFMCEPFDHMEYADSDVDVWEDKTIPYGELDNM